MFISVLFLYTLKLDIEDLEACLVCRKNFLILYELLHNILAVNIWFQTRVLNLLLHHNQTSCIMSQMFRRRIASTRRMISTRIFFPGISFVPRDFRVSFNHAEVEGGVGGVRTHTGDLCLVFQLSHFLAFSFWRLKRKFEKGTQVGVTSMEMKPNHVKLE